MTRLGEGNKQLFIAAIIAGALGGGGGGVLSNQVFDPAPDRFTGSEGKVLEARVSALEESCKEVRKEVDELPPDWFEADFSELKAEVRTGMRELHETGEETKIELVKIHQAIESLRPRGHWSPNDIIGPGMMRRQQLPKNPYAPPE